MSYVSTAVKKLRYLISRDGAQLLVLEKNNGAFAIVELDTPAARDAAVSNAVNNLIAGAPGALDTLNELAAALSNDANFAATVTTSLGNRLVWKGAWVAATAYVRNDLVMFNGGLYAASTGFTSGGTFSSANWTELVPQIGTYAESLAAGRFDLDQFTTNGGGTDDQKMALALAEFVTNGPTAGFIILPARVVSLTAPMQIPDDSPTSPPNNRSLTLLGYGPSHNGAGGAPSGGTIVDFTYNGGLTAAKIDSRSHGYLAMRDLTLRDLSGGNLPFLQVTNTTPILERIEVWGSKTRLVCDQDAFVLGGGTRNIDGSSTAKFDGYKAIIRDCHFHHIRRAAFLRPGCNDALVEGNIIWNTCGAPDQTFGAIDLIGSSAGTIVGNVVRDNTIEVTGYPTGIRVGQYAKVNSFLENSFYDSGGTAVQGIYCDDNASYNLIEAGYTDDSFDYLVEHPNVYGQNEYRTSHQSQKSRHAQPHRFNNTVEIAATAGFGVSVYGNKGSRGRMKTSEPSAVNGVGAVSVCVTPATQVSDAVLTNGAKRITSASNGFLTATRGAPVGGTGVSSSTLIAAVDPAGGWIDMNKNATSGDGVTPGSVYFAGSGTELTMTMFKDHHIESSGSTPSIAADAALNNSSGAVLTGTDMAGSVTLTPGGAPTAGQLCHWAPAITWSAAPRIGISPGNDAAVAAGLSMTKATNSITVRCVNAPTGPITFDYVAIK